MDPGRDHEFAEFVDGRFTALQRFGYLLTGEWHLAEDLVQTSLTKVWFHRNSLRSGNALESYTRTVMVNTSTQWWRRKWRGETPTEQTARAAGPGAVRHRRRPRPVAAGTRHTAPPYSRDAGTAVLR